MTINPNIILGSENSIFLKINPLLGERYVTKVPLFSEIENIFSAELDKKGFSVFLNSQESFDKEIQESVLFLEIFIYQFAYNFPTMRTVIRNEAKILYEEEEFIKNFGNIYYANEDLAIQLSQKIPHFDVISKKNEALNLEDFSKNSFSLNGLLTNSIMENTYIKNHQIEFELADDSQIEFFYDEPIEKYLKNLTNFTGFRSKLKVLKSNYTLR